MADKDVTMRLGTELKSGGADALKQLGSAAKDAADQEKRHAQQLKDSVSSLLSVAQAKEKIAKTSRDIAAGSAAELKAEREYQQLLGNRIKQMEQAKRLQLDLASRGYGSAPGGGGPLGEMGHMMGLPPNVASLAGAFAALTATVKAADAGLNLYKESFYRGQFHEGAAADTLQRRVKEHAPAVVGENVGAMNRNEFRGWAASILAGPIGHFWAQNKAKEDQSAEANQALNDRIARTRSLMEAAEAKRLEGGLRTQEFSGLRPLRMEQAEIAAKGRFGLTSAAPAFDIEQRARGVLQGKFWQAGQKPGYGREQEMADFAQKLRYETGIRQHDVEARRQLGVLGAKRGTAGQIVVEQQQAVAQQRKQVAIATTDVHRVQSPEQEQNARLVLERQMADLMEKEKRLQESLREQANAEREATAASLALHQTKLGLLRGQSDTIAHMRQEERGRVQRQHEQLGLMHPMELMTNLSIARRHKQGLPLSFKEIQHAQQRPEMFGPMLQKIGAQRYKQGPFAGAMKELEQLTGFGAGARLKELDKVQAKVDADVRIELGVEKGILDQIQKKLAPVLAGIDQRIKAQVNDALNRQQNQNRMQQNNMFGG